MPFFTVVIVNFNSGDRLRRCLDALADQTFKNFDVIVIDNASSDESLQKAKFARTTPAIIHAGGNLGFAAANNRAVDSATGEWVAFLNPDAYATTTWLAEIKQAIGRNPEFDAFGSTQLDAADPTIIDGAGDVFHFLGLTYRGHFGRSISELPPTGECFAPCAAAAVYRRSTFQALGGFDERFFCYGEDVDLGFRLRLAGGRALQVSEAVVHHEGSGVTGRQSDFTVYHGNRNRIWLTYKNLPGLIFWPTLPLQLLANAYLLARSWTIGLGPAYWRALKDGYGGLKTLRNERNRLQRERKASVGALARVIAWSPTKVSTRSAKLLEAPAAN